MNGKIYLDDLTILQADLCKSFTNPVRITIIRILAEREQCITQIAKILDLPVQNISQHMKVLKETGIVNSARIGHKVNYYIGNKKLLRVCELMREALIEILKEKACSYQKNLPTEWE